MPASLAPTTDASDALRLSPSVQAALRVSVTDASGCEAVIPIMQPGHSLGEVSLLVSMERVYDTVPTELTEMAMVSAPDFHRLIASMFDIPWRSRD